MNINSLTTLIYYSIGWSYYDILYIVYVMCYNVYKHHALIHVL